MPIIKYSKLRRERREYRHSFGMKTLHDRRRTLRVLRGVLRAVDEAAQRRGLHAWRGFAPSAGRPTVELNLHILEFVTWIEGHAIRGGRPGFHRLRGGDGRIDEIDVLPVQGAVDSRILRLEGAENMVEGAVLQHQHHEVLDGRKI